MHVFLLCFSLTFSAPVSWLLKINFSVLPSPVGASLTLQLKLVISQLSHLFSSFLSKHMWELGGRGREGSFYMWLMHCVPFSGNVFHSA